MRSYLVLPLRSRGQTIGTVALLSRRPRAYSADEFATAGEFVARASTALDNALLYEEAVRARSAAEAARSQAATRGLAPQGPRLRSDALPR